MKHTLNSLQIRQLRGKLKAKKRAVQLANRANKQHVFMDAKYQRELAARISGQLE